MTIEELIGRISRKEINSSEKVKEAVDSLEGDLNENLSMVRGAKSAFVSSQNYELASYMRDAEKYIMKNIQEVNGKS